MKKKQPMQPEEIWVINSNRRVLEVDYNCNTCDVRMQVNYECSAITLSETEAKRLHKALSRFLSYREYLRDNF